MIFKKCNFFCIYTSLPPASSLSLDPSPPPPPPPPDRSLSYMFAFTAVKHCELVGMRKCADGSCEFRYRRCRKYSSSFESTIILLLRFRKKLRHYELPKFNNVIYSWYTGSRHRNSGQSDIVDPLAKSHNYKKMIVVIENSDIQKNVMTVYTNIL